MRVKKSKEKVDNVKEEKIKDIRIIELASKQWHK